MRVVGDVRVVNKPEPNQETLIKQRQYYSPVDDA